MPHHVTPPNPSDQRYPSNYTSRRDVRRAVLEKTSGHCAYCGCELGDSFAIDHVVPVDKGGATALDNFLPSCKTCNTIKGNRDLERFRVLLSHRAHGIPRFTPEQELWLMDVHGLSVAAPPLRFWYEEYL